MTGLPVIEKLRDHLATSDEDAREILLTFTCPGCKCGHHFRVKGEGPVWQWNGDYVRPTFSPSLLVWASRAEHRCHSFVRDGMIQFLEDCAHDLKGQTVALPFIEA